MKQPMLEVFFSPSLGLGIASATKVDTRGFSSGKPQFLSSSTTKHRGGECLSTFGRAIFSTLSSTKRGLKSIRMSPMSTSTSDRNTIPQTYHHCTSSLTCNLTSTLQLFPLNIKKSTRTLLGSRPTELALYRAPIGRYSLG